MTEPINASKNYQYKLSMDLFQTQHDMKKEMGN